eukprot:6223482-Lingulodinium_polyedra.AAC.1
MVNARAAAALRRVMLKRCLGLVERGEPHVGVGRDVDGCGQLDLRRNRLQRGWGRRRSRRR